MPELAYRFRIAAGSGRINLVDDTRWILTSKTCIQMVSMKYRLHYGTCGYMSAAWPQYLWQVSITYLHRIRPFHDSKDTCLVSIPLYQFGVSNGVSVSIVEAMWYHFYVSPQKVSVGIQTYPLGTRRIGVALDTEGCTPIRYDTPWYSQDTIRYPFSICSRYGADT